MTEYKAQPRASAGGVLWVMFLGLVSTVVAVSVASFLAANIVYFLGLLAGYEVPFWNSVIGAYIGSTVAVIVSYIVSQRKAGRARLLQADDQQV